MKKTLLRLLTLAFCLAPLAAAGEAFAQRPRFYMVMFAADGNPSQARTSHTFATFVRTDGGRVTQELTVSWLPAPGHFGPGYTMPTLGIVPGHNYTLDETITLSANRRVSYWGPYEITPTLYERAARRVDYLSRRSTQYKMMVLLRERLREPALHNQPGGAINCIMAVSDIGGYLDTGSSWGTEASRKVLGFIAREIYGYPYEVAQAVAAQMRLQGRLQRF